MPPASSLTPSLVESSRGRGNVCRNSLSRSSVKVSAGSSSLQSGKSGSHSWAIIALRWVESTVPHKGLRGACVMLGPAKWSECLRSHKSLNFSSPMRDPNKTLPRPADMSHAISAPVKLLLGPFAAGIMASSVCCNSAMMS